VVETQWVDNCAWGPIYIQTRKEVMKYPGLVISYPCACADKEFFQQNGFKMEGEDVYETVEWRDCKNNLHSVKTIVRGRRTNRVLPYPKSLEMKN
jgi:hypothetical protein